MQNAQEMCLDNLGLRMDRIEKLELYTSIDHFSVIDERVWQLKATAAEQPDLEPSPLKHIAFEGDPMCESGAEVQACSSEPIPQCLVFDMAASDEGFLLDAAVQTAQKEFVESNTQWDPADIQNCEADLDKAQEALDKALGYSNAPISRSDLRNRADALLKHGVLVEDIKRQCDGHNAVVDNVRAGDTLLRVCGDNWTMYGHNGRIYFSESKVIKIDRVHEGGGSAACSDPRNGNLGKVDLVNYLFDIQHG